MSDSPGMQGRARVERYKAAAAQAAAEQAKRAASVASAAASPAVEETGVVLPLPPLGCWILIVEHTSEKSLDILRYEMI